MVAAADRLITLPEGIPTRTLGWNALAWAAKYLRHPNGIRAGQRWQFTREQARFILWFYAVNNDGRFVYYHAARRLAKGSGKSPFAAVMALIELLAPVRLDHFDDNVLGGCVGKQQPMPLVQIAAVSQDQTENTMRMVRAMVAKRAAPQLNRDYQIDAGKTQINVEPAGKLEVITSSAASAEGAEATFIIGDELEHWTNSNGGTELHRTLLDNLAKSGSRMLETLNAWKPGTGSAGEETFEAWTLQEDGRTKSDRKILYDSPQAPPDTDLADEASLRAGLAFVYEDCPWADLDAIVARIWHPKARPDDSKRKYLNWPTASLDSWCDPQDWAQMSRPDRELVDGEQVVLFFDGSLSNDHTALIGCCMDDGHVFTAGVWAPPPDGVVDVEAVDAGVQRAFDRFEVLAFFADVREWESFVKVDWPERYGDQLRLWATPGARNPEPIAWDMRSKDFPFTQACELAAAEIVQHAFTHDGNPLLSEHVRNAQRHLGRYGETVRKESRASQKKIDAAVCMIGARMVYRMVKSDPSLKAEPVDDTAFFY